LKILGDSRACSSAIGNWAAGRVIIEMGRVVALNSETLAEVPDKRSLKSISRVVSSHTPIRAKANTATAGSAKSRVTYENFNLGTIVRRRTLRQRACAHQNHFAVSNSRILLVTLLADGGS